MCASLSGRVAVEEKRKIAVGSAKVDPWLEGRDGGVGHPRRLWVDREGRGTGRAARGKPLVRGVGGGRGEVEWKLVSIEDRGEGLVEPKVDRDAQSLGPGG